MEILRMQLSIKKEVEDRGKIVCALERDIFECSGERILVRRKHLREVSD